jgi:uncharacterized protein YbjQ (UPF0145 family)
MKNLKNVLVTTTSSIDGVTINQYIKPIAAHIVAGTGLFSDWAASFTDVLGGRSNSYQKQLTAIYEEAIDKLKKIAIQCGANGVIGLKIDIDEISGKSKSMFMITAFGTAVSFDIKEKVQSQKALIDSISSDDMVILRKRQLITRKAFQGSLVLDDETWQFITENKVGEIAQVVFDSSLTKPTVLFGDAITILLNNLSNYLYSLPVETRTSILYKALEGEHNNGSIDFIMKLMKQLYVFDFDQLMQLLNHDVEKIRGRGLQTVVFEKELYSKDDILMFEALIALIETKFRPLGEVSSQKKLLSSKEKEIWICRCNTKNEIDEKYCSNCKKDIYGFYSEQFNPETAIAHLKSNIEAMHFAFKTSNN